jgi:hypothetical protein
MIATTAITIDKIASLRMAMPNLHAKIKQQRGGFRDFFEVGVGKASVGNRGEKETRSPLVFSRHPFASDDHAGGELMAAKVRPLPV